MHGPSRSHRLCRRIPSTSVTHVSGIGPAETLRRHNISVVADRPGVDQNMWDHVVLNVGHQVTVETYGHLMDRTIAAETELDYAMNQAGILTNDQSDYLGWEELPAASWINFSNSTSSNLSSFPSDWPEVEYEISSAPFDTPPFSTPENPTMSVTSSLCCLRHCRVGMSAYRAQA